MAIPVSVKLSRKGTFANDTPVFKHNLRPGKQSTARYDEREEACHSAGGLLCQIQNSIGS